MRRCILRHVSVDALCQLSPVLIMCASACTTVGLPPGNGGTELDSTNAPNDQDVAKDTAADSGTQAADDAAEFVQPGAEVAPGSDAALPDMPLAADPGPEATPFDVPWSPDLLPPTDAMAPFDAKPSDAPEAIDGTPPPDATQDSETALDVGPDVPAPADAPLPVNCPTNCDDGDPCTIDTCPPGGGTCAHTLQLGCFNAAAPCTTSADCKGSLKLCNAPAGKCVGCVLSADCGPGLLCQNGGCVPAVACASDKDCKPTAQVCSKADGACVDCNGSDDCPAGLSCVTHKCVKMQGCKSSKECADVCNLALGVCTQCQTSADCASSQLCNVTGTCAAKACLTGACIGLKFFPCLATGAGYGLAVDCDDGSACTTGETCMATGCKAGSAVVCDDGKPCTDDSCALASGCTHKFNAAACSDGNACTQADVCKSGACIGSAISCDDNNVCTSDVCQAGNCVSTPTDSPCDDGTACTVGDKCGGAKCLPGVATVCDDGNSCTTDTCDASKGCQVATTADKTPCGKLLWCKSGICVAVPLCGNGKLEPENGEACDDGNVVSGDGCDAKCKVEPPPAAAGTLVISEVMVDPRVVPDVNGEWIEVYNPTKVPIDMTGWSITSFLADGNPAGSALIKASCGNGFVEASENCDDGNKTSGDGCSEVCQVEGQCTSLLLDGKAAYVGVSEASGAAMPLAYSDLTQSHRTTE